MRNKVAERMVPPETIREMNNLYRFRNYNPRPEDAPNFYRYLPGCFLLGMATLATLATYGLLRLMEKL